MDNTQNTATVPTKKLGKLDSFFGIFIGEDSIMKAKGSYSIEAAVITGLICLIYFIVMNVAIGLFLEIRHEDEHKRQENLWIIAFHTTQLIYHKLVQQAEYLLL